MGFKNSTTARSFSAVRSNYEVLFRCGSVASLERNNRVLQWTSASDWKHWKEYKKTERRQGRGKQVID